MTKQKPIDMEANRMDWTEYAKLLDKLDKTYSILNLQIPIQICLSIYNYSYIRFIN